MTNDACHFNTQAFPCHQISKMFLKHSPYNCKLIYLLSQSGVPDSAPLCDTVVCFLHIQEIGTCACDPNTHETPPVLFYTPRSDHKILDRALSSNFCGHCACVEELLAWLLVAAAPIDNSFELGEIVQVQDVDALVSCWILEL